MKRTMSLLVVVSLVAGSSWVTTPSSSGSEIITVESRIAAGSDDAEERSNGAMKLTSSDLELVFDRNNQVVGLRFANLSIPEAATIEKAFIQFEADESQSEPTSLQIRGQASENASTFTNTSFGVSSRPMTTTSVDWGDGSANPLPAWVKGDATTAQQTPDLSVIIQEIVDLHWTAQSDSMAFIISGTGKRTAESFNGKPLAAPLLHVEYVPGNFTPTTSGIADVNVNTGASATVVDLFAAFDDVEDPDSALTFTIENNTNPALFAATTIDGAQGTLTLDFGSDNGTADITVRATDTGTPALFVEVTFTVTISPVNQPPTTSGIADVTVAEDAVDTTIDLTTSFDDPESLPSDLNYTIESNTNTALFTTTSIDGALDTLTLDHAPDANGIADITIRATDTGFPVLFVETTFTVTVTDVNDTPNLLTGSVDDLIVASNSPATPLGLASVSYGPGGDVDETSQTLSYAVTSVPPTLGDIVLADGVTVVTPGAYTLAQIQGLQFKAFPAVLGGPETLTFTITDNGTTDGLDDFKTLNQSLQITISDDNPEPLTFETRVAERSDDAEERSSGIVKFTSKDLELVDDPTQSGAQQTVGIRFTGVAIPQGATITSAYLQFEAAGADDEVTTLQFKGQAADNAATFTTADFSVTSRPVTSASAFWSPLEWTTTGEAGANQRSTDLAPVIQEIVDRGGWVTGNSLAIIITGFGERKVVSYDGDVVNGTNGAALLHVEYTAS